MKPQRFVFMDPSCNNPGVGQKREMSFQKVFQVVI